MVNGPPRGSKSIEIETLQKESKRAASIVQYSGQPGRDGALYRIARGNSDAKELPKPLFQGRLMMIFSSLYTKTSMSEMVVAIESSNRSNNSTYSHCIEGRHTLSESR
jgi:hypothetical protein